MTEVMPQASFDVHYLLCEFLINTFKKAAVRQWVQNHACWSLCVNKTPGSSRRRIS